jgi:outer membrane protein OmpA-like peptidoglycan-associated protein
MLTRPERSQLQMQMGQEVIYLLLASSMLGCIVLAAYVLLNMRSAPDLRKQVADLTAALASAEGKARALEDRIAAAGLNDKPPIILLPEARGFTFESGSAQITASFAENLKSKIPQIVAAAKDNRATVIEVIGHTDGVAVGPNLRTKSNLDFTVSAFMDGQQAEPPIPYDNAGLGLARAIATAKALRDAGLAEAFRQAGLSSDYQILPLSAANLISTSDRYSPAPPKEGDQSRRRIEIRLRRPQAQPP